MDDSEVRRLSNERILLLRRAETMLARARDILANGHPEQRTPMAPKTLARVRGALKSIDGAIRHEYNAPSRIERQQAKCEMRDYHEARRAEEASDREYIVVQGGK